MWKDEAKGEQTLGGRTQIPVVAGEGVRYVVPQEIDGATQPDECVTLSLRVTQAQRTPRFIVETLDSDGMSVVVKKAKTMVAVPAEMVQIMLRGGEVAGATSVQVRVEGQSVSSGETQEAVSEITSGRKAATIMSGGGAD